MPSSALRGVPTDIDPKVRRALEELRNELIRVSGQQQPAAPARQLRPSSTGSSSSLPAGVVSKANGGFGQDASSLTASIAQLNNLLGSTGNVQEQLNGKQASDDVLTALVSLLTGVTVTIGANDSGGSGFRALIVPNV